MSRSGSTDEGPGRPHGPGFDAQAGTHDDTATPSDKLRQGLITPAEYHTLVGERAANWSLKLALGGHLAFPWSRVQRLTGWLLASFLVLVGARAKSGKSTFLRECFTTWVHDFKKRVLFLGTEQEAHILRMLWACVRLDIPIAAAMDPTHPRHADLLYDVEITQEEFADRVLIVAESSLTTERLKHWARVAWLEGYEVLMIDHFHRIETQAKEAHRDRGELARTLKNIAVKADLLVVAAAQLKDGEDGVLGHYSIPGPHSWAETAGLRRECDKAVQLWKPFRRGVTAQQRTKARNDAGVLRQIVESDVMAVRCDADRYSVTDRTTEAARLAVHPSGRLTEEAEQPWLANTPPIPESEEPQRLPYPND